MTGATFPLRRYPTGPFGKLDYEQEYSAKSKARKRFLDYGDFEPPLFQCHYDPDRWTEDILLSCILDPEGYADKEAADYIAGNQDDMLFDFLCNDVELAEYQALVDDRRTRYILSRKSWRP